MGKTSVLLSVIDACSRGNKKDYEDRDNLWNLIQEIRDRVVWLEPIATEQLPSETNLFAALLARIDRAIQDRLQSITEGDEAGPDLSRRGAFGWAPDYEKPLRELQNLQSAVAIAWDSNLPERGAHLDPDTYAVEVVRAEQARLSLRPGLERVLDHLARRLYASSSPVTDPVFVLPVDDVDLDPLRCLEILKLLRLIQVPRLFTIVLGDIQLVELALNLKYSNEFAIAYGGRFSRLMSIDQSEVSGRAGEVAANAMRKLIPPAQRILLERLSVNESLDFRPFWPTPDALYSFQKLLEKCPLSLDAWSPARTPKTRTCLRIFGISSSTRRPMRYLLAAYLCRKDRWGGGLYSFVNGEVTNAVVERAGVWGLPVLCLVIGDLLRGALTRSGQHYASVQGLYRRLTDIAYWEPLATTIEYVHKADPIATLVGWDRFGRPSPEMRFLVSAFHHLESNSKDSLFPVLFWQVVRVRNLLYRHVVQRPMTPGMQWFIRFYGRIGPARRPLKTPVPKRPKHLPQYRDLLVDSAARLAGIQTGLRSLEVRTSPGTSESRLLLYITNVDATFYWLCEDLDRRTPSGHRQRPQRELGLVFHFTKDRGGGAKQGKPTAHGIYSNADPRWFPDDGSSRPFGNPSGYRYARFFNGKMMEARSLASVLRRFPISIETIRGIDVATDELGVPTWVIALLFRHVRKAGIAASETLRRRADILVPPLRATAHAGEDFIHLMTGLRHVDEAIARLELREGDRIGHGVALGVDPHAWCHRAGRIAVAREERLFDLVWELSWYGRGGLESPGGRVHRIEREVARLSKTIFGLTISPFDMELLTECLYSEHWLFRIAGFPHGPPPDFRDCQGPAMLCLRYLTDGWVFRKGQELEWIDPSPEAEALAGLQAAVRRKLGERGITVEVNPSSNLLIADLGDLAQHPLWRLSPPPGVKVDAPPVSICIGSDNPLTFVTNLPEEYQLLLDALVLAGCSEEQARQWLNRVRETGLENRFTVPRSGLAITSMMNP